MATARPFAFNTGSTISGTTQVGSIAIGTAAQDYSGDPGPGGVKWWMGPDEELGYVIGCPVTGFTHPTPVGIGAGIEFWRSKELTEQAYIDVTNVVSRKKGNTYLFSNITDATNWLGLREYPTSFVFEPETLSLIARMDVEPSYRLKDLINKTIKGLKDDGIWDLADCLYIRGVHDSQAACQNWVKDAHNSTLFNSPTFIPKVGFTGANGKYIDNNYNLYSQTDKFKVDSATIMFMCPTLGADLTNPLGVSEDSTTRTYITHRTATNDLIYINSNSSGAYNFDCNIEANDYITSVRENGYIQVYKNGVPAGPNRVAGLSTLLSNVSMTELAVNSGGVLAGWWSSGSISMSFYGGLLNSTKVNALYSRIKHFNDNIESALYEPEIISYISGLTTPLSSSQLVLLDTFVRNIKTKLGISNLSDAFDVIYILAGETSESSLRNLVKRAHDASTVSSPSFIQYQGFSGGTGKYITTNYNPASSSQGIRYTRDSASNFVYVRTNILTDGGFCYGLPGYSVGSGMSEINIRTTYVQMRINAFAGYGSVAHGGNVQGILGNSRLSSAGYYFYKNKTGTYQNSPSEVMNWGNRTILGNPSASYTTNEISLAMSGRGFTTSEVGVIVDEFEAYMDGHGKGVI